MSDRGQRVFSWHSCALRLVVLLSLFLSGCYAGAVGVTLGIVSLAERGDGDETPPPPSVLGLEVPESKKGAGRPLDLSAVEIRFLLKEPTGEPANVSVEYSRDNFESDVNEAKIREPLSGLRTSPDGELHTVTWDASADGFTGYNEVALRITAEDKDGATSDLSQLAMGNDAPRVLVISEPTEGDTVSDVVVVRFELADSAGDLASIEFRVSVAGRKPEVVPPEHVLLGNLSNLPPGTHALAWDSKATLGPRDEDEVVLSILPRDFEEGQPTLSASFRVRNNSPPEVFLIEPLANPDADGALLLRFLLRDDEGDPGDVVIQWATEREAFDELPGFEIAKLSDPDLRRRVLLDPDERGPRHIVTPHLRTILEARCRRAGEDRVALTGITPPTGITPQRLVGATLELLSDSGAPEQVLLIGDADPRRRTVKLAEGEMFNPEPREGQRLRVRESVAQLFLDLEASATREGARHDVAWDTPADVGVGRGDASYFLRATAFKAGKEGPGVSFTTTLEKPVRSERLSFREASTVRTGGQPDAVAAADLNGDGRLDLVSADSSSHQLSPLLAESNGSFRAMKPLRTGQAPASVVAADLNEDGLPDLVSADSGSGQLSLFLAVGDGNFQEPATLRTGGSSMSVAVADLNGDSLLDLVSADKDTDQLSLFLAEGEGRFQSRRFVRTGDEPLSVAVADLNGDGQVDLVSADQSSFQLSVFIAEGDGRFRLGAQLPTEDQPYAAAAADLNGDGRPDLVAADRGSNQLSVFLAQSDGEFGKRRALLTGVEPQSIAAVDLNRDGRMDLVSADLGSKQLSVFVGQGDGIFRSLPTLRTGNLPYSVVAADLNADGYLDLVSADWGSDQLSIFVAEGDVRFGNLDPLRTGLRPTSILAADFNGDGHLDIVSADRDSNQLSLRLGEGDGTFPEPETLGTGEPVDSVLAGDWNGDGLLDIISVHLATDVLRVFFAETDGGFRRPRPLLTGAGPASAATADLNGDGDLDIASADSESNQLSLFFARGDGWFERSTQLPTGIEPSFVLAVDLNGDGHSDLVSADQGSDQLSLFLAEGDGRFEDPTSLRTGARPVSAVAADLNGDGQLDLISADSEARQLSVFLADTDAEFLIPSVLRTGNRPNSVVAADVSGDGHLDLVSADQGSHQLSILLGRGDGTFQERKPLSTEDTPRSLVAADVNGDGHLDLVSGDFASHQLSIFPRALQRSLPPAFFGLARATVASTGVGHGRALVLSRASPPHRINTSAGTIDGEVPAVDTGGKLLPAFVGHAFHFESVAIEKSATVVVEGEYPLVFLVRGDALVAGQLLCDGLAAEAAGARLGLNGNAGSAGGLGGPSGNAGGHGGGTHPGSRRTRGARGGGPGGGGGGRPSGQAGPGAGGGHAAAGGDAVDAGGGSAYGNDLLDPLFGGSGGGGGSILDRGVPGELNSTDTNGDGGDLGGGGGGGGGGAVRITAGGRIRVSGRISANGGDGGRGRSDVGGHGGGGSGGSILLQAYRSIVIESGAVVSAEGGNGATGKPGRPGGDGAPGRIRFETDDGSAEVSGSVTPQAIIGRLSREEEPPPVIPGRQRPGDATQDGRLNLADAVVVLELLFLGAARPLPCTGDTVQEGGNLRLLDLDGNERLELSDAVRLLNHLFLGGPSPLLGTKCVGIAGCPDVCTP